MSSTIHIAHSPDADDAFMFAPLFDGKVDRKGLEFADVREDIEGLNQKAQQGVYEVTAVSIHAFPYIAEKYRLLSTGACFGNQYGPMVVASKILKGKQLLKVRIGIPGKMTTAFLVLRLFEHHLAGEGKSGICYSQVPFDQIMEQVVAGKLDAGLIIHEGQLTYAEKGLHKIVDLGEWWHKETKLPLPLGGIVVRKDLDPSLQREIGLVIQESIKYALEHREETLQKALPFARGLDPERADKFIGMYVNDLTVDCGRAGHKAIKALLERGYREGVVTKSVELDENFLDLKKTRVKTETNAPEPEATAVEAAPMITEEPVPAPAETTEPTPESTNNS